MKYTAKQPDENGIIHFTDEENGTWQILVERQLKAVQNRACDAYLNGLQKLNFRHDRIPQCSDVTAVLQPETGWSVVPVAAMIPLQDFFQLLSRRQFPAASFIRLREDLDYLQEPDIFHEFFGHCPMLTNKAYADFVHWYGETALHASRAVQSVLGRLFWFTVEFGLLRTDKGIRIFGGGILSSYAETIYALESDIPERKNFDLIEILNKSYRYDIMQECYYCLDDLADLFSLKSNDIMKIAEDIASGKFHGKDFILC